MPKKLKNLRQTNGQLETEVPTEPQRYEPITLAQIWGETGENKYGTFDRDIYQKELTEMNKADLYREALKRGIMPTDQRNQLEKKLLKAFQEHKNAFHFPANPIQPPKVSAEVMKILAEGR